MIIQNLNELLNQSIILVEGPLMTKVAKSNRSWQILSLHGHIVILHAPVSDPLDTKYVQFSDEVCPQFSSTI